MLLPFVLTLGLALGAPMVRTADTKNPLHANLTCVFEHGIDHKCVRARGTAALAPLKAPHRGLGCAAT